MALSPSSMASGMLDLVDHGSGIAVSDAAINRVDTAGVSPLMKAARAGDINAVRALLSAGAKVNTRDKNGDTAVHYAAMGDHARIVAILLTRGAIVNAQDDFGRTALHIAAMRGDLKVSKILIDHGADGNLQDKAGNTPLVYIPPKLHTQLLALFLARQYEENKSIEQQMERERRVLPAQ
ncbi:MAG: ankyrin repeat domain-containing protein [Betaproteobacteria bacterium]|nr:ankyrin repeat domain-containing protein [Betaproteobacteria bacterium]